MRVGDQVSVYPKGKPALIAVGSVQLISGNQVSLAVFFKDIPPFKRGQGILIGLGGCVLILMRQERDTYLDIIDQDEYTVR